MGVVRSSTVTQPDDQSEPAFKESTDDNPIEHQDSPIVLATEDDVSPGLVENHPEGESRAQNTQSGNLLAVKPVPMGRSSR